MTVLVDPPAWPWRGRLFSHLVSDVDLGELHDVAARSGVHPRAFDGDHYDIPDDLFDAVVASGAVPVDGHELITRLNASGLRVRKRRGEKLLDSVPDGFAFLAVPHRVDVVRSTLIPPPASTVAAVMFVGDRVGRRLMIRHPRRGGWEAPGGWVEPGETGVGAARREVREETGLNLEAASVAACGYERITFQAQVPPGAWHAVSHVAVFETQVEDAGSLSGRGPEGAELAWFDGADLARRCGRAPWWSLLAAQIGVEPPPPAWTRL